MAIYPVLEAGVYTYSAYVYVPAGSPPVLLVLAGSYASGSSSPSTVNDGWQRLSVTFTVTGNGGQVAVYILNNAAATAGQVFYMDDALLEKSPTLNPYFDGSTVLPGYVQSWEGTPGNSISKAIGSDFTYGWEGTANASTSTEKTSVAWGWGGAVPQSSIAPISGMRSAALFGGNYTYMPVTAKAGETFTFSLDYKTIGVLITGGHSLMLRLTGQADVNVSLPVDQPVAARFSATITALSDGTLFPHIFGPTGAAAIVFDNVLIEKSGTAKPYFDGEPVPGYTHTWLGTPGESASTEVLADETYSWSGAVNASTSKVTAPGLAAWFADAGSTVSRCTLNPISGSASAKVINRGTGRLLIRPIQISEIGTVVTASFDYRTEGVLTNGAWGAPTLALAAPSGALIAFAPLPLDQQVAGRFSVTATVIDADTKVDSLFIMEPFGVCHIDNVLIEKSDSATPYFDGNTITADSSTYSWVGTANASTSQEISPVTPIGKSVIKTSNIPTTIARITDVNTSISAAAVNYVAKITGTGQPEGLVTATIGARYIDLNATCGAVEWIKASGSSNTGWKVVYGDTGSRNLPSLINGWAMASGSLGIRRIGDRVTLDIYNIVSTSATADSFYNLPLGFRAKTYGGVLAYFKVLGDQVSDSRVQVGVDVQSPNRVGDIYGQVSWITDDPWPTTLPGTAY